MIQNLKNELEPLLKEASKLYVATALINNEGFDFIEHSLPPNCERNYLIGIDLPSDPKVFERILELDSDKNLKGKIYKEKRTYHPKVYIIYTKNDEWFAFIGSGNTTGGGLFRNVEMSLKISDTQQCTDLINWFSILFEKSFEINTEFVDTYKSHYKKIKQRKARELSDFNELFFTKSEPIEISQDQFFALHHFEAYSEENHKNYTLEANARRKRSKDRLKELHNIIYPLFEKNGLDHLICHHRPQNITSLHYYIAGFNNPILRYVWVEYGYVRDNDTLKNHPRLQVVLGSDGIGVWFVIGSNNNGSFYERNLLKRKINESEAFTVLLFNYIKELGASYYLNLNGIIKNVNAINGPSQLAKMVNNDDFSEYFIISRTFRPDDPILSQREIAENILIEFRRLYPIYDLIRDKRDLYE